MIHSVRSDEELRP